MRNRGERRKQTESKFISRLKKWFQFGTTKDFESYRDLEKKEKWTKLLRHNKLYGRSTMNNMEKHKTNKDVRKEGKKILKEEIFNMD